MIQRNQALTLMVVLGVTAACPAPEPNSPADTPILAASRCDTGDLEPIALDAVGQSASPLPVVVPRLDVLLLAPQPRSKDCASGLKTSTPCTESAALCALRFSSDEPERVALLLTNPTAEDTTVYALRLSSPCARLWVGEGESDRAHQDGDIYDVEASRTLDTRARPFILYLQRAVDAASCSTTLEIESDAVVGKSGSGNLFVDIEWS